ncbi:MAG: hypothetical protein HC768_13305 [Acaryochloris sp. CRU_2_0]|nr:hypothetical protein [Acaryochloris sp. CRU_2_0]
MSLVQGMVQENTSAHPQLWFVTQGAQSTPGVPPAITGLSQSLLWGLGKSLDLEHPELRCVRIDLAPTLPLEQQIQSLGSEIKAVHWEEQVALREKRSLRCPADSKSSPPTDLVSSCLVFLRNSHLPDHGGAGGGWDY